MIGWPRSSEAVIKLHPGQWVRPCGLVGLACIIASSRRYSEQEIIINHDDCESATYWERMGFWKALMLPGAPSAMAHHDANGRFSELEKVGDDNETDETVNRIISTLGLDEYSPEWKVVNHIIAESINNVCHHSDSLGYAAAQYYPKTDVVEISIGDYGIGLRQSLSRLYPLESDGEAILKALEPNVTSNPPHPGKKSAETVVSG